MNVGDIMSRDALTVNENETVAVVAKRMQEQKHGFVVVIDKDMPLRVIGVLSDTDIIGKVVAANRTPDSVHVKEIMTVGIISAKEDQQVTEAAQIMRTYHVKRLPVLKDGKLAGVISSTDIMHSMIDVKKLLSDIIVKL